MQEPMPQELKNRSVKIQLTKDNNGYKYTLDAYKDGQKLNIADDSLFAEIFAAVGLESYETQGCSKSQNGILKKLWIVIYPIGDLLTGKTTEEITALKYVQKELLTANEQKENKEILPIIHLVATDIFLDNMYGGYDRDSKPMGLPPQVPRSYQIMDSSIWNYLVPLIDHTITYEDGTTKEITVKDKFKNALDSISDNYDKGLYCLEVANEYADLNARMFCQSYLRGTHASGVSPFIFHSESAIEELIEREFKDSYNKTAKKTNDAAEEKVGIWTPLDENKKNVVLPKIKQIAQHNWRILLVDDKAITPLSHNKQVKDDAKRFLSDTSSKYFGSNYDLPRNCKLRIIEEVLCEVFKDQPIHIAHRQYKESDASLDKSQMYEQTPKVCDNTKTTLLIEYVETMNKAESALREKKYDIILLDYLLDESYGYELLETIYNAYKASEDKTKLKYKYGPHELLYFMFISAYSSAVYERLLAEGFNRSEECWYIAVGACPTNTPKLFAYNLLQLMHKQLKDSGISRLTARGIYNVVSKIYNANDEEAFRKVRLAANENYQEILNMYFLYKKMLRDVDIPTKEVLDSNGSTLITDFITKNVNLGGLLEHLIQLVHLTAFGTVRQWSEMWEEYIYFKAQFNCALFNEELGSFLMKEEGALSGRKKITAEQLFSELCCNIENYILQLKSL